MTSHLPGKQPRERTKIDWSHPLARDLIFFATGGVNLVDNTPAVPNTQWGPSHSERNVLHGEVVMQSHATTGGGFSYFAPSVLKLGNQPFVTLFAKVEVDSKSGTFANFVTIPISQTSWSSPYGSVWIGTKNNKLRLFFDSDSAGFRNDNSSVDMIDYDGSLVTFAVSKNRSTTSKYYKNGVLEDTDAGSGMGDDIGTILTPYVVTHDRNAAGGEGYNGREHVSMIFARQLSDDEVRMLDADPYLFLVPDVIPVFQSAGGVIDHPLAADTGAFVVSGKTATLTKASVYDLPLDTGALALIGQAATLTHAQTYNLTCDVAALTVDGQAVSFSTTSAVALSCDVGVFDVAGNPATLTSARAYNVTVTPGVFSVDGKVTTFTTASAYELDIVTGVFDVTGNAAILTKRNVYSLSLDAGSFDVSGQPVSLSSASAYDLDTDTGSFGVVGNVVSLGAHRAYVMTAETGSFGVTGRTVSISADRVFDLNAAAFALAGISVSLLYIPLGASTRRIANCADSPNSGTLVNSITSGTITRG